MTTTCMNVTLGKLKLKNPILTASGTFGNGIEFTQYGDLKSLGGIVVKGLSLKPRTGNPGVRIAETPAGMLNAIGLQNQGLDYFLETVLPKLPHQQTAIITNLYGQSIAEFSELAARLMQVEGVAALEVNISCPNVKEGGIVFGQDPKAAFEVTSAIKNKAGTKPVIIKLSPNVTDIKIIAKAAEDAGADIISCINTVSGMAIDLRTRKPRLTNIIGGLSGPAIKPVALRCVWQVCQTVKIPVIGIGGIICADDILEFLLAGAKAVQIGTANLMLPNASFNLVEQLEKRAAALNINSIEEFSGSLKLD